MAAKKRRTRAPNKRLQLTKNEEMFIHNHVVEGMTPYDAIKASGYKATAPQNVYRESYRILERPLVKKRIDELLKKRDRQFLVDKKFVVERLKKIAIEKQGTALELKALEHLGKYLGIWTEKIDLSTGDHAKTADEAWAKRKLKIIRDEPDEAILLGILNERSELKDEQEEVKD